MRVTEIIAKGGKIAGLQQPQGRPAQGKEVRSARDQGGPGHRTARAATSTRHRRHRQPADLQDRAARRACSSRATGERPDHGGGSRGRGQERGLERGRLSSAQGPSPPSSASVKSRAVLPGSAAAPCRSKPISSAASILSPFLLSAAPPSDGYEQMKKAYEAGWAGGVMKTAFDGVPIHIPSEYMFAFTQSTYANCDNVSGPSPGARLPRGGAAHQGIPGPPDHGLDRRPGDRQRRERQEGLAVQHEEARGCGIMGIEYSLSCPQGGDGTKGDIVSQDAELTAKIIGWVMDRSAIPTSPSSSSSRPR